jgi:starch phosphorylase
MRSHSAQGLNFPPELQQAIDAIRSGTFGDPNVFEPLLSTLTDGKDYYLVSDDFQVRSD